MEIDGVPITDTIHKMYQSLSISEFMQVSFTYCQKHEAEMREHILCSENGGAEK